VSSPSTSICLICRTALARGESCDGGPRHRVADLHTPDGREEHRREVWGPPSRQERLRTFIRHGAAGSGVGAALQCLDCGVVDGGSVLGVFAGIAIVAALFILVASLVSMIRGARLRRRLVRPYGAITGPRLPNPAAAKTGVAEGTPLPSPLGGEPCLAFSIVLRTDRQAPLLSNVLWREASTDGFTVRLDDGTPVRIPAGRVRIAESTGSARSAPRARAAAMLPAGLGVEIPGELSELPFDSAFEQIIRANQRVAILSRTQLREDPDNLPASPRATANLTQIAVGVPVLRCLD
jgi:hypothetical protein